MEISRRRIFLQKHLEPARPLRRVLHFEPVQKITSATSARAAAAAAEEEEESQTHVGIDQFFKILNLQKEKKGRISYSRDFLVALATCPQALERPPFLPQHSVVLNQAREPEDLAAPDTRWTGVGDEEDT